MNEPVVYLNGLFVPLSSAKVSILDRGFAYGDGLFETMRAYKGRVFRLNDHIERLVGSLRLVGIELPATEKELRCAIQQTLEKNACPDSILRMTVSRGEQDAGFTIDPEASPTLVIQPRPLQPLPGEWYEEGIDVALFPGSAVKISGLARQVKSCNFLSYILIREQARQKGAVEGILMDDHHRITEGTTSNIFVVKDGVLKTPELNQYILPGITRQVVLEIAVEQGIPAFEASLTSEDIFQADEVFITNSAIELVAVKKADAKTIGAGKPGEITRYLHREYLKHL